MPRGGAPCCCCGHNGSCEAAAAAALARDREEPLLRSLTDQLDNNPRPLPMETTPPARDFLNVIQDRATLRLAKFIVRGLMILLWLYFYNSMRRYAISYIGEDTWFSTFVVIVVAVPMTEYFCIIGQITNIPPPK